MINKIMGTAIPKATQAVAGAAKSGAKESRTSRFLKSESLGRVLEVAAENQNVCQAGFALAICCGLRPVSNYVVTEDKKDAWFANAHSMSSGLIGFAWPLVFATPLAAGVKHVLAKPQKYLKPELVKKFYPNVGMVEEIAKDGTKTKKIATNIKGEMLRKDGSILCKDLEPLMIYKDSEKPVFEKAHPNLYVDKTGVVRSKDVFKTERGVYKLDEKGEKIGVAVQKDLTPITEEMEIGAQKEKNVQTAINMSSDILLAPIRASLTIKLIPVILGALGIEKPKKAPAVTAQSNQNNSLNVVSTSNNTTVKSTAGGNIVSSFSAFKKGGV